MTLIGAKTDSKGEFCTYKMCTADAQINSVSLWKRADHAEEHDDDEEASIDDDSDDEKNSRRRRPQPCSSQ